MATVRNSQIVTDGLMVYLDASNDSSYVDGNTTWDDLSRNDYNGDLINSPTFSGANYGSLYFNGSNQYVDLSDFADSLIFDAPATIDLWFKPNYAKTTVKALFAIEDGNSSSTADGFEMFYGSLTGALDDETIGVMHHLVGYGNSNLTQFGVEDAGVEYQGIWTNVCFVISASTWTCYINGEEKVLTRGSGTANNFDYGDAVTPKSKVYIGARHYNGAPLNYFDGDMASFKLYNKGLTSQEVTQNYNAIRGRFGL